MSTGQKIIHKQVLSITEADQVCRDLQKLERTGVWDLPVWSTEVAQHYEVGEAHQVVQMAGWKAVALAFREGWFNMSYKEYGE